jgi:hypothetical protein
MGDDKTELVTLIRHLEIAAGFFIRAADVISDEGFAFVLEELGKDYLVLSITLSRGSVKTDEASQIEQRTTDLKSFGHTDRLAQACRKIAELILQDIKNL